MDEKKFYRTSTKALITDDSGRVLLLTSDFDQGKWEVPGSGLEQGEDPIESLKYHIEKETGVHVTYISESPEYFITAESDRSPGKWLSNVVYRVRLDSFDFKNPDYKLQFFSLEEAKREPLLSNTKRLLEVMQT